MPFKTQKEMTQCKNCLRWVVENTTQGECKECIVTREVTRGNGSLWINGKKIVEVRPEKVIQLDKWEV